VGDQAVPAGRNRGFPKGITPMLRLQALLPDRYTLASSEEIEEWIGAAKAALGSKLLILGHHYQRPEVIKWADARGDSFKLATSSSAACTSWPSRPTSSPASISASSSRI